MKPDIIGIMKALSQCRGKIAAGCLLLMTLGLIVCKQPPQPVTLPDFESIQDTEEKKMRFFSFLSPIIRQENERVLEQRERLLHLYEKSKKGSWFWWWDRRRLDGLSSEYEVDKGPNDPDLWQSLLRRVDIVPLEMALVQAAKESAWGTSRFAREGNTIFGEYCFDEGCGIVPDKRRRGAEHEVQVFKSVNESVRSYIHNLNTHDAYRSFRRMRFRFRREGRPLDAYSLAGTIPLYSERRDAYIVEIRHMIRENRHLMGPE